MSLHPLSDICSHLFSTAMDGFQRLSMPLLLCPACTVVIGCSDYEVHNCWCFCSGLWQLVGHFLSRCMSGGVGCVAPHSQRPPSTGWPSASAPKSYLSARLNPEWLQLAGPGRHDSSEQNMASIETGNVSLPTYLVSDPVIIKCWTL